MKPKILYFVPDWPASSSGVLHSTVLAEAGFLHRKGLDCFFIGTDVSAEKAAEAEKYIGQKYGIRAKVYGCYSQRFKAVSIFLTARKVARLSKDIISSYCPTHVWTRSFIISNIGRKIAQEQGAISVFSVRAARAEEVALSRGKGIKYRLCRLIETYELKKSDRLAGVSHKLKQWVHDITGRDDLVVIPCCFDKERFYFDEGARKRIRQECRFGDDEKIICYSGGLSKWQRVPDILKLCLQISKMHKDFKFLFLTQEIEQLRHIAEANNLSAERYVIKSCIHQDVPQYLSAADVGIIMRDDIPANNVASPIKIGEYLICGLPVILTRGIGDYSEALSTAGVGLVLDENSDMAKQVLGFVERSDFEKLRQKAIDFARKNVSWESHLDDLKRLFSTDSSGISKE